MHTTQNSSIHTRPELFVEDCLSRHNHKENKNNEIMGIKINIIAIDTATGIPKCMAIQEMQQATAKDDYSQQLR